MRTSTDEIKNEGHIGSLYGVPVHLSELCTKTVPVRKHKRRRGQSLSYHRRIKKKWLKRFGVKTVPTAYLINNAALQIFDTRRAVPGRFDKVCIMHPDLWNETIEYIDNGQSEEISKHAAMVKGLVASPYRTGTGDC